MESVAAWIEGPFVNSLFRHFALYSILCRHAGCISTSRSIIILGLAKFKPATVGTACDGTRPRHLWEMTPPTGANRNGNLCYVDNRTIWGWRLA